MNNNYIGAKSEKNMNTQDETLKSMLTKTGSEVYDALKELGFKDAQSVVDYLKLYSKEMYILTLQDQVIRMSHNLDEICSFIREKKIPEFNVSIMKDGKPKELPNDVVLRLVEIIKDNRIDILNQAFEQGKKMISENKTSSLKSVYSKTPGVN